MTANLHSLVSIVLVCMLVDIIHLVSIHPNQYIRRFPFKFFFRHFDSWKYVDSVSKTSSTILYYFWCFLFLMNVNITMEVVPKNVIMTLPVIKGLTYWRTTTLVMVSRT